MQYFIKAGFDVLAQNNLADAIMDIISGHGRRYWTANAQEPSGDLILHLASRWMQKQQLECISEKLTAQRDTLNRSAELANLIQSASQRGAKWHVQAYHCFLRSLQQQCGQLKTFFLEIFVGAITGLSIGLSARRLDGLLFPRRLLRPLSTAIQCDGPYTPSRARPS